jgi:hypothetical protein
VLVVIVDVAVEVAVVVWVVLGEVRSHSNVPKICSEIIAFKMPTKSSQDEESSIYRKPSDVHCTDISIPGNCVYSFTILDKV